MREKTTLKIHTGHGLLSKTTFLLALTVVALPARGEDIKVSMRRAFDAYQALQPFLANEQQFSDPKNEEAVFKLIKSLQDDFHDLTAFPTRFQSQPGFASNVTAASDILDDAAKRFREGSKSYAAWRLRAVSQNCISCHSTYNVELAFQSGKEPRLTDLTDLQKGEFFLATRQLDKAEAHLKKALTEINEPFQRINVLRRLLTLYVRVKGEPALALTQIQEITKNLKLPQQDREEVHHWLSSLKEWSESTEQIKSVVEAQTLIKRSMGEDHDAESRTDAVGFLRATRALHMLLAQQKLSASDRPEALYLLGLSYSKLPLFFIEELPEFYLRQCIEEAPGTKVAQRAYRLYKDIVEVDFTGSGGTTLPTDVRLKLMELHDKAYGIPHLNGKV